jgi:hypothetical protein
LQNVLVNLLWRCHYFQVWKTQILLALQAHSLESCRNTAKNSFIGSDPQNQAKLLHDC